MKYTNETQSGVRSQETIHRRTESVPGGVRVKPRLSPPLPTPNPSRSTPTSPPFLHPYSFQFYPLTPEPIVITQWIGLIDTNGNDPRRQHPSHVKNLSATLLHGSPTGSVRPPRTDELKEPGNPKSRDGAHPVALLRNYSTFVSPSLRKGSEISRAYRCDLRMTSLAYLR